MSNTVNIFIDTLDCVWGDGVHLNHNDTPFRANLKIDNELDINGNIKNSSGTTLTYSNSVFTTPKPVKLVLSSGNTTPIDFYTAFNNAGVNLLTNPINGRADLSNDNVFCNDQNYGMGLMFGELNDIAKKSDGSNATNDTEAVYFEIVLYAGKSETTTDFVGSELDCIIYPSKLNNGNLTTGGYTGLALLFFDRVTMEPKAISSRYGELVITNNDGVEDVVGFGAFSYSFSDFIYSEVRSSQLQIENGDVLRFELNSVNKGIINISKSQIYSINHNYDLSNTIVVPALVIRGGYSENSMVKIDNFSISISNPA